MVWASVAVVEGYCFHADVALDRSPQRDNIMRLLLTGHGIWPCEGQMR